MKTYNAAMISAVLGVAAVVHPVAAAIPQGQTVFMAPPINSGRTVRSRAQTIPWSYADSRPGVAPGQATGLYIWHDRNTVHVQTTDNHWFGSDFRGTIEIVGGKFDNVYNEQGHADTRLAQPAPNRLVFHFRSTENNVDGFKFNLSGGHRLIFRIGEDGHPTARIYYGQARTPSNGDPVAFDLNK